MRVLEKISVIIPVYNVEEYLEECILSVINQTYKNLEIILVDDGSIDKSGYICDEYIKKDLRIKVIHKINGGLSSARNVGIDNSTGDYLMFIDSDDYIKLDTCELLIESIKKEKADIVICDFYRNEKENKNKKIITQTFNSKEAIKEMLLQNNFDTSAWGKLFKKEVFKNIYFPEGKIFEDLATIYNVFDKADKIVYIAMKKYFYRIRQSSIMNSKFNKKKMDIYDIFKEINNFLLKKYSDLIPYLRNREIKAYIHYLVSMYANNYKDLEDIKILQDEIKRDVFKYVIFNKNSNLFEKIFGICFFISFKQTKNIIIFLKKIKNFQKE